jgi:putative membrane protein insertion efficiency factor
LKFISINFLEKLWAKRFLIMTKVMTSLAILFIGAYRTIGTSFLGGCCRFEPSCSEYAIECFHKHSFLNALKFTIIRLIKCRPLGPIGFDLVPEIQKLESLNHATK